MTATQILTSSSPMSGYPTTNVYCFRDGKPQTQNPEWQAAVETRLKELMNLEIGWDGYQGQPVALANVVFAFCMLESICTGDSLAPQIVPGSSGDIQLEWHLQGGSIELDVRAPNDVHAWRQFAGAHPVEEERTLTTDFSLVAIWLRELMEAPFAPHTAAM